MLDVIVVSEYDDKQTGEKKSSFTRVGAAFESKDGSGWNIVLNFPVGATKMILRPPQEKSGFKRGGGSKQSNRAPF